MRVKMPDGHVQVNVAGTLYTPDVEGAFEMPEEHFAALVPHGAVAEASAQDFEAIADRAEDFAAAKKAEFEAAVKAAQAARTVATAAKNRQRLALKTAAASLNAAANETPAKLEKPEKTA